MPALLIGAGYNIEAMLVINNYIIAVAAMLAAMCLVSVRVMPIQTRVSIAAPMAGIGIIYFLIGNTIGNLDFITSLRWGLLILFSSIIVNIIVVHLRVRIAILLQSLRRGNK